MTTTPNLNELYIYDNVFVTDGEKIKNRFQEEGYGIVKSVELIKSYEGECNVDHQNLYSAAFVVIEEWFNNEKTCKFQKDILDNNVAAQLMHDNNNNNNNNNYWEFEVLNTNTNTNTNTNSSTIMNLNNKIKDLNSHIAYLEYYFNYLSGGVNYLLEESRVNYLSGGVNYLLEESRVKYIKKERKKKMEKIAYERRKAQRQWKNRLRPLDKLK